MSGSSDSTISLVASSRSSTSPFCALREAIRAKGEIRAQVSTAAGAAWTAAFAGVIDPETKTRISHEGTPTLERSIEYDNEQLRREIIPTFKRMCGLCGWSKNRHESSIRSLWRSRNSGIAIWRRLSLVMSWRRPDTQSKA